MNTQNELEEESKLLNKNYICCCISNFLLYFSFYLIVSTLALYLTERFDASGTRLGLVLSVYVVSALLIRPFSAYLIDSFPRKPLFMASLILFCGVFLSYQVAASLIVFALCRIVHGLAFGMVTIAGNTIVIDVIPSKRRGEGLGYYGWSNNLAMAIGPGVGMYLHDNIGADYRFQSIFWVAFGVSLLACITAYFIVTKYRPPVERPAISMDRFFLRNGIPAGINLVLLSITYGITMNYISLYTKELELTVSTGMFYSFMAIGIAGSRVFSGKLVDKGYLVQVIQVGSAIATLAFASLGLLPMFDVSVGFKENVFLLSALTIGIGYGIIFPAYNTLFVALGTNSQRGSATSTYLTSWEIGVGIGIFSAGAITKQFLLSEVYIFGSIINVMAIVMFSLYTAGHFMKNKIGYMV